MPARNPEMLMGQAEFRRAALGQNRKRTISNLSFRSAESGHPATATKPLASTLTGHSGLNAPFGAVAH
jgi:hypothetical protein